MSSGASSLVRTVSRPVDSLLQNIGVGDESTRGLLSGGLTGGLLGGVTGAFGGGGIGQQVGQALEDQRKFADSSEAARQQFNDDVFRLAQNFEGRIAQNEDVDFGQFNFQGADDRTAQLDKLTALFKARQQEVIQQRFQPGVSQTRLSLIE